MLASKIICDDTYSNKSSYLEWQLNVDPTTLRDSQAHVQHNFAGPGPYPPTVLPQPAPAPFTHQSSMGNISSSTGTSIPAFAPCIPLPKGAHVPITSEIMYFVTISVFYSLNQIQ